MINDYQKQIANETDLAANDYYYPNANGESNGSSMYRSLQLVLSSGALSLTVEASNDGTNWEDVTALYDNENGASSLTASGFLVDYLNKLFPYAYLRVKVSVSSSATFSIVNSYKYA